MPVRTYIFCEAPSSWRFIACLGCADYVLQRALTVADQDQKEALVELIKPQLAAMRKSSHHHGRHLVASECLIRFVQRRVR